MGLAEILPWSVMSALKKKKKKKKKERKKGKKPSSTRLKIPSHTLSHVFQTGLAIEDLL